MARQRRPSFRTKTLCLESLEERLPLASHFVAFGASVPAPITVSAPVVSPVTVTQPSAPAVSAPTSALAAKVSQAIINWLKTYQDKYAKQLAQLLGKSGQTITIDDLRALAVKMQPQLAALGINNMSDVWTLLSKVAAQYATQRTKH